MPHPIPVVDLFAGPGGLGEGFTALGTSVFELILSAEKEPFACRTLRLRAFKRLLERYGQPDGSYYRYLNGLSTTPYDHANEDLWHQAALEARQLTLGEDIADQTVRRVLDGDPRMQSDWVLIGGPPCQAYSVVGRARNRAVPGYRPEDDERHFLYREYLKLIQEYRPKVFVMENVTGLLSSRVFGDRIFDGILRDLADPDRALGRETNGKGYRLHSLVDNRSVFTKGCNPETLNGDEFSVFSQNYGIPQTRNRVIILGVREDTPKTPRELPLAGPTPTVRDAIADLPRIRSRLTRRADLTRSHSADDEITWRNVVRERAKLLAREARASGAAGLSATLNRVEQELAKLTSLPAGSVRFPGQPLKSLGEESSKSFLTDWYSDPKLEVVLNHDARGHMPSDLGRYLYCACFALLEGFSPKSHTHFDLPSLAPEHRSWKSGHFADRFRVQVWDDPGKTITSHIHKDGHYFIHPDPVQCRSLTVREAARIQTFPDNYFFEGNRTEQFIQVGNAVPPLLSRKIAEIVCDLFKDAKHDPHHKENPCATQYPLHFG